MQENLPPGFRFHPTDEELITYYLGRKVSDVSFTSQAVAVVDLNKCEPWDLPGSHFCSYFAAEDRNLPFNYDSPSFAIYCYYHAFLYKLNCIFSNYFHLLYTCISK